MAGFEMLLLNTYSPSTMEYVESIRYALQDLGFLRQRKPVQRTAVIKSSEYKTEKPAAREPLNRIKTILHGSERSIFKCINAVSDRLGCGCNLMVVAKKI
jgi:hypothetical protein